MYKVMLTTNRGLEDITAKEVKEILGIDAEERPWGILGRVLFKEKDLLKICKFTYVTKTSNRVILFLHEEEIERNKKGLDQIYKVVKHIDWSEWLAENLTFRISTERFGIHEFNSMEIMKYAGQAVIDSIQETRGYKQKVDLENPDIIIRVDVIGDKLLVGVDITGKDGLHKRKYKAYHHPAALKTTLANQLVRLSNWNPKEVLLDPCTGSGTIPIEAGLNVKNIPGSYWRKFSLQFTKLKILKDSVDWVEFFEKIDSEIKENVDVKGIYGFDKFIKHVRGAEMNSIRAMVRDIIRWSRVDLEWLDVKLQEGSIDKIVTNPPFGIKIADPKEAEKVHKLLFYQAEWILNDEGTITIITARPHFPEIYSKQYGFEKIHERTVWHGNLKAKVFIYQKTGNK